MEVISISEIVKELETKMDDKERELGEARATMLVNFGDEGKCVKGLCSGDDSMSQMIIKVFSYYYDEVKKIRDLIAGQDYSENKQRLLGLR